MAKRLDLQKYLLIILLLTFSLGEVARIQFSDTIAIKALDVAVFLFVIPSVVLLRSRFKKSKLTNPILIFSSIESISLLVNMPNLKANEFLVSLLYLVRWVTYAGAYFIVANFETGLKKKIPNLLVAMGGAILSLGFVQYLLYPDLRNLYYLGWDEHLYRLFSTFLDPNFAGAFFVLYFLFVLGLFMKSKNLVYGFIATTAAVAIILTFSRSAYLMLFVGLFTFMILQRKKKLLLIFVALFVPAIVILSAVGFKSEGTNLLRITSSGARIPEARNALAIFGKNPIFGVGFNAYQFASERYGFSKTKKYIDHSVAGTDNSFLFVLATTGAVGLIAYLYLWSKIISFAKSRRNIFSAVIISSSVALFVGSLFVNSLFYAFIMLWMWILLGLFED
ncbi:MAG: O-antigen ligase family protein [Candidatus Levyibacteriota bacterium]